MTDPDPRDGGGGWGYMDVLLDEYAKTKDLDPADPERRRVETTMRRQRERILALERE
jgi:hypothetical protein